MINKTLDLEHDCRRTVGNPLHQQPGQDDPVEKILGMLGGYDYETQNQIVMEVLGKFESERMNRQSELEKKLEEVLAANKFFNLIRGR